MFQTRGQQKVHQRGHDWTKTQLAVEIEFLPNNRKVASCILSHYWLKLLGSEAGTAPAPANVTHPNFQWAYV
jgi:hypothetical protein